MDAATFPRQKVCGEHLSAGAWPLLTALGVASEVRSQAVPIDEVSLVASHRHRLTIAASAKGSTSPVTFSRYRFDEMLVNHAAEAGVEVRLGFRMRNAIIERGEVQGLTASCVSKQESAERLEAPVIIAADGRQSVVVRHTGNVVRHGPRLIGFKRHFPRGSGNTEPRDANSLAMHSLPGGYVGAAPVEDGSVNLCGVLPRRLLSCAEGGLNQVLADWMSTQPTLAAMLSNSPSTHSWSTIADVSTQFAEPRVRGVLYVGDALGTIEPLTGQGMTMALASAFLARSILADASPSRPPSAIDQQRYATSWQSLFRRSIQTASAIGYLMRRPHMIQAMMHVDRLRHGLGSTIFQKVYHSIPVSPSRLEKLTEPRLSDFAQQVAIASGSEHC
jgi:flavin-dependent dehydrogenase